MTTKQSIHWLHPGAMFGLWLAGLAFAIGHNSYYSSLDGKPAQDQQWVIRYGTAFAYLTKAAIATSVGISLRQYVWALVRTKQITIKGLDACFSLTLDPTSLGTPEVWIKVPGLAVLSTLLFAIPLAAIVTPASISVTTAPLISQEPCLVPTLNFSKEFDWQYSTPQLSLATYRLPQPLEVNQTSGGIAGSTRAKELATRSEQDDIRRGFYAGPSPYAEQLLRRVFVGGQTLSIPSPCGPNCTYSIMVPGIGYRCERVSANSPPGKFIWEPILDLGDPKARMMLARPYQNRTMGFWVVEHGAEPSSDALSTFLFCQPWRYQYEMVFTYIENSRTYTILSEKPMSAISYPTFPNGTLGLNSSRTNYWAYEALADVLAIHINGSIFMKGPGDSSPSTTLISATSLVRYLQDKENPNKLLSLVAVPRMGFQNLLVELVRNFSLSMLEESSLHTWTKQSTTCEISSSTPRWTYDWMPLLAAYSTLLLFGALALWVGATSIYTNGCTGDISFSRFLCTTRNSTLDEVVVGERFGAQPMGKDLKSVVLQFGQLSEKAHVAFGKPEQIIPLIRGEYNQQLA